MGAAAELTISLAKNVRNFVTSSGRAAGRGQNQGSDHAPRALEQVGQIATATSATLPTEAVTALSTGSALGARVRRVQSPSPAKNRK